MKMFNNELLNKKFVGDKNCTNVNFVFNLYTQIRQNTKGKIINIAFKPM